MSRMPTADLVLWAKDFALDPSACCDLIMDCFEAHCLVLLCSEQSKGSMQMTNVKAIYGNDLMLTAQPVRFTINLE